MILYYSTNWEKCSLLWCACYFFKIFYVFLLIGVIVCTHKCLLSRLVWESQSIDVTIRKALITIIKSSYHIIWSLFFIPLTAFSTFRNLATYLYVSLRFENIFETNLNRSTTVTSTTSTCRKQRDSNNGDNKFDIFLFACNVV